MKITNIKSVGLMAIITDKKNRHSEVLDVDTVFIKSIYQDYASNLGQVEFALGAEKDGKPFYCKDFNLAQAQYDLSKSVDNIKLIKKANQEVWKIPNFEVI